MLSGASPLPALDDGDEAARAEVDKEEGETVRTLAGANTNACFVSVVSFDGFSFSFCGLISASVYGASVTVPVRRFGKVVGNCSAAGPFAREKKCTEPGCGSENR